MIDVSKLLVIMENEITESRPIARYHLMITCYRSTFSNDPGGRGGGGGALGAEAPPPPPPPPPSYLGFT